MPIDTYCLPFEDQLDLDAISAAIWEMLNNEPELDD